MFCICLTIAFSARASVTSSTSGSVKSYPQFSCLCNFSMLSLNPPVIFSSPQFHGQNFGSWSLQSRLKFNFCWHGSSAKTVSLLQCLNLNLKDILGRFQLRKAHRFLSNLRCLFANLTLYLLRLL